MGDKKGKRRNRNMIRRMKRGENRGKIITKDYLECDHRIKILRSISGYKELKKW